MRAYCVQLSHIQFGDYCWPRSCFPFANKIMHRLSYWEWRHATASYISYTNCPTATITQFSFTSNVRLSIGYTYVSWDMRSHSSIVMDGIHTINKETGRRYFVFPFTFYSVARSLNCKSLKRAARIEIQKCKKK